MRGLSRFWLATAAVVAVGVLLGVVGLLLPAVAGGGGETAARKQVASRAADFAVAYNTYDVADLDDYQRRLSGLLSPDYEKQFVEVTDAVFAALKDKKQKSGEAKVLSVAIESIDDDSAEALVAVDASITNTDNAAAVLRHFRWKVSFAKDGDRWDVSNFESVAAVSAVATPAPSATPSTPTAGPSEGADE